MSVYETDNTATTRSGFPVVDVTHKPKRTQADNIRLAMQARGEVPEKKENEELIPPSAVTLESAIKYYENADTKGNKSLAALYARTVLWLKDIRTPKRPDIQNDKEPEKFSAEKIVAEVKKAEGENE